MLFFLHFFLYFFGTPFFRYVFFLLNFLSPSLFLLLTSFNLFCFFELVYFTFTLGKLFLSLIFSFSFSVTPSFRYFFLFIFFFIFLSLHLSSQHPRPYCPFYVHSIYRYVFFFLSSIFSFNSFGTSSFRYIFSYVYFSFFFVTPSFVSTYTSLLSPLRSLFFHQFFLLLFLSPHPLGMLFLLFIFLFVTPSFVSTSTPLLSLHSSPPPSPARPRHSLLSLIPPAAATWAAKFQALSELAVLLRASSHNHVSCG